MARSWQRSGMRCVIGLIGFALVVGPWPAVDTPYTQSQPFRDTVKRLDRISPTVSRGELRVGLAEVPIQLDAPVPVAGFLDRIWQPYADIQSRCFVRALTIAVDSKPLTIVTADLLLIDAAMVRRVLSQTGLPREAVYFTATHTHGGPGGWGNHPLERLVAGTYDPAASAAIATSLVEAIIGSRARLQSAEMAFVQVTVPEMQRNRVWPNHPTNDRLFAWVFRRVGSSSEPPPPLAVLASFGAHATIGHPQPSQLSSDYPGAFAAALQADLKVGMVLFAAGTVGDAAPVRPPAPTHRQSINLFGKALAGQLRGALGAARFKREVDFANFGLQVDLVPVQVPCGSRWLRFSPLGTWWVGRPQTFLHVVRLGPAVLAGFPGDFAGHLGERFPKNEIVVATSFNGEYQGYLVPRATFEDRSCYETRTMNFFGPDLGELLVDLSMRMITRIAPRSR